MQAKLRKWLHLLRLTPLHPQFFAYKYEQLRYRLAGLLSRGRVLDIGCGRQTLRRYLNQECEYIGLDYPTTSGSYGSHPHVYADGASLPFGNDIFDTVVCLEVLEHVCDPDSVLLEASRVLKPGGLLLLSIPFLYPIHDAPADLRRWTRYGLEQAVAKANLHIESFQPLGRGIETGALLFNLNAAWGALQSNSLWKFMTIPCAGLISLFMNSIALFFNAFSNDSKDSPFVIGYFVVLRIRE